MYKVGFAGPPDSGKTTLAKAASSALNLEGWNVEYIDEVAREFIYVCDGYPQSVADQYFIFDRQRKKERRNSKNCDIVLTDSPSFLAYVYALALVDFTNKKDVYILSKLYAEVLQELSTYDIIFLLEPFREPVRDGVRDSHIERIAEIQVNIKNFLDTHKIEYMKFPVWTLSEGMRYVVQTCKESFA